MLPLCLRHLQSMTITCIDHRQCLLTASTTVEPEGRGERREVDADECCRRSCCCEARENHAFSIFLLFRLSARSRPVCMVNDIQQGFEMLLIDISCAAVGRVCQAAKSNALALRRISEVWHVHPKCIFTCQQNFQPLTTPSPSSMPAIGGEGPASHPQGFPGSGPLTC